MVLSPMAVDVSIQMADVGAGKCKKGAVGLAAFESGCPSIWGVWQQECSVQTRTCACYRLMEDVGKKIIASRRYNYAFEVAGQEGFGPGNL